MFGLFKKKRKTQEEIELELEEAKKLKLKKEHDALVKRKALKYKELVGSEAPSNN